MKGGKGQRERTPPPQRRETKGKSDRKGGKGKGKGKGEGKNRLMDDWDKSWFTQGTGLDGQTKPICMRHNLSQCTSQKCAFVHCCLSRSVTVRCAAPQTTKQSRALTVRAEFPPRDSSRRRKRQPASRNHCPSRITSVTPQNYAHNSHVQPEHSARIRRFHWTCLRDQRHRLSLTEPQCNSDTTEECKHEQSRPFKVQRTSPTVPLNTPSSSTSPLPVTESEPSALITGPRAPARYCLDICAGRSAPFVSCSHHRRRDT